MHRLMVLFCLGLLTLGCGQENLKLSGAEFGSSLSPDGGISNPRLLFVFEPYRKAGRTRDLFNYIYFKGDTLCFNFRVNRLLERERIQVWFEDSAKNRFPAERIDVTERSPIFGKTEMKISGFTLVGSILENFYKSRLDLPLTDHYCCRGIPFRVVLEVRDEGKILRSSRSGEFRIEYR